jgi:hypothetical protein
VFAEPTAPQRLDAASTGRVALMKVRRSLSVSCVVVAVVTAGACTAKPPVNRPTPAATVTGPVTGGKLGIPFTSMPEGMAQSAGYAESEYFVSGTAMDYSAPSLPADGRWSLRSAGSAPYKSRVVVRRPVDPARFSGNVIVEWFNVTGGVDVDADFGFLHPEIFRAGDAYVGVSAQKVGIDNPGTAIGGIKAEGLKTWDPQRYGSLNHPGDRYSYDIFSQVGAALKSPAGVNMLGGLKPQRVIGAGESQSAGRLISYIDGVHPLAKVYDGYLVHSRFANGAGFDPVSSLSSPAVAVRADLGVPVLQFVTETDLVNLNFKAARQPDTDKLRTWEVTGTAHADKNLLDYQGQATARTVGAIADPAMGCKDINDGPQRYVVRRAWADLKTWVAGGAAPAHGAPIAMTGNTFDRDARGNALGGIRTPAVDAPIAAYSGLSGSGSGVFCFLFGSTKPFDAATLKALYPTHDDYVAKVTAAADQAVSKGFLSAGDAPEIIDAAKTAPIPS